MKHNNIIIIIILGLLLLFLLNRAYVKNKKDKINTNLYNPLIITKNQERQVISDYNKKINNNNKWISDDLLIKRCYNLCQNNYKNDYKYCLSNCEQYKTF